MQTIKHLKLSKLLLILTLLLALGTMTTAVPLSAQGPSNNVIPDNYIVQLHPGQSSQGVAQRMSQAHGLTISHIYSHAINGFAAVIPAARLDAVRSDPAVFSLTQDRVVTIAAPPCWVTGTCDGGGGSGQTVPTGITRIDGDLSSTVSGDGSGTVGVDVAVIDTGIDLDHADLNVVGGVNCSTGNSYNDGHGHGTHVAGTIAAKDDGGGVVGVTPGARLYAVRVLDNSGRGSWSSVACGVDWVTANAATIEVANMSLGGSGSEPSGSGCATGDALHDAICNSVAAGVTYAVAAGNSSADAKDFVPAAYDEVITVSALADFDGEAGELGSPTCRDDEDDTFANFSNYGADVDLIAPGVCIESTWKDGGYNTISGTSMASPHVAGAAALYIAGQPSRPAPETVKSALQNAGNTNWNDSDDPDDVKEKLVNVDAY